MHRVVDKAATEVAGARHVVVVRPGEAHDRSAGADSQLRYTAEDSSSRGPSKNVKSNKKHILNHVTDV